jgi:hypothetical protein
MNGNVGINTPNPLFSLDISGNINITNITNTNIISNKICNSILYYDNSNITIDYNLGSTLIIPNLIYDNLIQNYSITLININSSHENNIIFPITIFVDVSQNPINQYLCNSIIINNIAYTPEALNGYNNITPNSNAITLKQYFSILFINNVWKILTSVDYYY